MKSRINNFIDLYIESLNDVPEEVEQELNKAGINTGKLQEQALQFIKRTRALQKIKEGEKFAESYQRELSKMNNSAEGKGKESSPQLKIACRNSDNPEERMDIEEEDLIKIKIISKLQNDRIKGKPDKNGDSRR